MQGYKKDSLPALRFGVYQNILIFKSELNLDSNKCSKMIIQLILLL
ncbi:hypothetical protein SAMN05421754_105010 [Nitrosomonas sp. Nm58]|nr:hypothetical protein SAMN05421754_105010 [Nitrosomonas sp. Nm58]